MKKRRLSEEVVRDKGLESEALYLKRLTSWPGNLSKGLGSEITQSGSFFHLRNQPDGHMKASYIFLKIGYI